MNTYIALFRGINVGGSNILPMKLLITLLENLGCRNVTTYIQSGNAVFRHEENDASLLTRKIAAAVHESHGFEPFVMLLTTDKLKRAMASNPFPDAETDPSKLHLFFLASVPENPNLDVLKGIRAQSERFAVKRGALTRQIMRSSPIPGERWPGSKGRKAHGSEDTSNRLSIGNRQGLELDLVHRQALR